MPQKKITELQLRDEVTGDLNFPSDDTIQSYRVTAAQLFDYIRSRIYPEAAELTNLTFATSVSSNALTIALKTKAGTNPTATDLIRVGFRSSTLSSGIYNTREITAATSLTISSGSTLGQVSGQASRIWVYLIDAGSSPELAVSGKRFRDNALVSTTAEGGAGGADSHQTLYSATARTDVPVRLIGYIDNTQATAGTWASAGTQLQLWGPNMGTKEPTITLITSGSGTYYTPAGCTRLRIRLVGGGGGGASSGTTTTGGGGNAGTDTTFGSLTGGGGGGGKNYATQGLAVPGSASGGNVMNLPGYAPGPVRMTGSGSGPGLPGAPGGGNPLGIPGAGGENNGGGGQGAQAGGAGAGGGTPGLTNTPTNVGSPGASGGYVEHIQSFPDASYAYAIGAGGSPGGTGTSGHTGGSGGSGMIIVEEFYD